MQAEGVKKIRGKRGGDAGGKTPVFFTQPYFAHFARRDYTKHRLSKFKGISKENFYLHLIEYEFRYNTKTNQEDLYKKLLKLIAENPLEVS